MILDKVRQEEERLLALHSLDILDTPSEAHFDRVTRLAKTILKAPMSIVSLVDRDRQWFKSRQGLTASETPRSISFCAHAIEQDAPLVVQDAWLDERFAANPLVTGPLGIRSYAGAQLRTSDGFNLGTLCVLDTKPRCFTEEDLAVLHDLAQLVMDAVELRLIATTDSLTGCVTRRAFLKNAHRDFLLSQRAKRPLSCLILDVDFFKTVNDTYGHAAGDRVLRKLADICAPHLRTSDYMGRLGGEEFAIILRDTRAEGAFHLAERLRGVIASEVFSEGDRSFSVSASIGIAETSSRTANFSDLLDGADQALYLSKADGRNRTSLFAAIADEDDAGGFTSGSRTTELSEKPEASGDVASQRTLHAASRASASRKLAFDFDRVRALFQPITNLRSGETVGLEALARLESSGELIGPAGFLDQLGQKDLFRLFSYMVKQGIELLRSDEARGLYVTINLEASLLLAQDFCKDLRLLLDRCGYAGEDLILELLEGDQITDVKHMNDVLNEVRSLGISVALDDIGSAYSSLVVLRDIPVDVIKLDRSFAVGLHDKPDGLRFVHNVLSLSRALGKRLIVEGIETREIEDAMRVLGVEFGQGFAIARPMAGAAIGPWLAARRVSPAGRTPLTLLGAYAGHLAVVEACRVLIYQPLPVTWKEESKDAHACAIGRYFDASGTHDSACGLAHKRFHDVMGLCASDMPSWMAAAESFRSALEQEIIATSSSALRCAGG